MKIKIGAGAEKDRMDDKIESTDTSMEMEIRKTLDGNYLIKDHIDVNILVIPTENKIVVVPNDKNPNADVVYSTQDRLFNFLQDKGVVDHDSVEGGDAYYSMEATYPESADENVNSTQAVIFSIGKFIEEEEPLMNFDEKLKDMTTQWFTNPDDEESTELGEVPQDGDKGSIQTGLAPFGQYFKLYEQIVRERYEEDE